jgi:hypothetical protein
MRLSGGLNRLRGLALAVGTLLAAVTLAGVGSVPASAAPFGNVPLAPGSNNGGTTGANGGGGSSHKNNHSQPSTGPAFTAPQAPPPYVPPSYTPPPATSAHGAAKSAAADTPPPQVYVAPEPPPPPPAIADIPPPTSPPPPQADPRPVVAAIPAVLKLTDTAIPPGGNVTAAGQGCTPSAPVHLSAGDVAVGTTQADPDGNFATALTTSSMDVGRHQVTAECGPTLVAPLDVVLVSRVGTNTSTTTIIMIFLLIGTWAYAHPLASHLSAWWAGRRSVSAT